MNKPIRNAMKPNVTLFIFVGILIWQSKAAGESSTPGPWQVKIHDANSRVWERVDAIVLSDGRTQTKTHDYIELETGLYYQENGQWKEAKEQFDAMPGGAVAQQGRAKVSIANNIHTAGSVKIVMPDGQTLATHPLGVRYYDPASYTSVIIADVQDCQGVVVPPNRVVFADAFAGFKADLRYTYTKAGLEQDVIFREQPPTPGQYNLPATVRLEMITELFDGPLPVISQQAGTNGTATNGAAPIASSNSSSAARARGQGSASVGGADEQLDWPSTRMGHGKAFVLGDEKKPGSRHSVTKQLLKIDGRNILIESIPWNRISKPLSELPKPPQASTGPKADKARHVASAKPVLPPMPLAKKSTVPMRLAAKQPGRKGYVLDYLLELSDYNGDYTFQGDTTYFISGPVYLNNVTLEGGAVIKFTNSGDGFLDGLWSLNCQTGPYKPAVFTSMDDDAFGDIVSGSSGSPSPIPGIYLSDFGDTLQYARFAYAGQAISGWSASLWHCQFVQCSTGLAMEWPSIDIHNVLFTGCDTALAMDGYAWLVAENVTADNGSWFASFSSPENSMDVTLRNCLFTRLSQDTDVVNDIQNLVNQYGNSLITESVSQPTQIPYVVCGGGSYYTASAFQNQGATDIDPGLLASLQQKTTYPPMVYSNATISSGTTLGPYVPRDTNSLPALGYHYDPLDYCFGGSTAATNLTFTSGTAVGWFRTTSGWEHAGQGIHVADGKQVDFNGTEEAPDYWVRANTVQEGGTGHWNGGYGPGGITGWATDFALAPTVKMRFTHCSVLAADADGHFRDDYGYLLLNLMSCEFAGTYISGYISAACITNCLFERTGLGDVQSNPNTYFIMQNCTMKGSGIAALTSFTMHDCALDGTDFSTCDGCGTMDFDYNAFLNGAAETSPAGPHDLVLGSFDWVSGPLGNYYQPINGPLKEKGDVPANTVGLYHYTTTTDEVMEETSIVTIGYHYVALGTNGLPLVSNTNGAPDYLADANGNGYADPGEIPWSGAPIISMQPSDVTVPMAGTAIFSVGAYGCLPLTYQWMKDGEYLANGGNISGADTAELTIANVSDTDVADYSVLVGNPFGGTTSASGHLYMNPPFMGYWSFNNTVVDWWPGNSNANDMAGTNNGTIHGGVTYAAGHSGQAFQFDGSTGYISFGTNAGNFSSNDFTIDFWMKSPFTGSVEAILGKRPICNWANMWNVRLYSPGFVRFEIAQDYIGYPDCYNTVLDSKRNVNDTNFHEVTITRSGLTLAIYIDGTLDSSTNTEAIANIDNDADMTAGNNPCVYCDGTHLYCGLLDEIKLATNASGGSPWAGNLGQQPLTNYGVQNPASPWGNALQVDSNTAATLSYRYIESNGAPNIYCTNGAIRFWFKPDWNGGVGPGTNGQLLVLGDGTNSLWSLYVTNSNLLLETGSNNVFVEYFTNVITNFSTNIWEAVTLDYSPTATELFLNGVLAQSGPGITLYPDMADCMSYGFSIGSDHTGNHLAHAQFDELYTYNSPLSSGEILANYIEGLLTANASGGGAGMGQPDWDTYNSLYGMTNASSIQVFTPLH